MCVFVCVVMCVLMCVLYGTAREEDVEEDVWPLDVRVGSATYDTGDRLPARRACHIHQQRRFPIYPRRPTPAVAVEDR